MVTIEKHFQKLFEYLPCSIKKPDVFEKAKVLFWDDPYISERLLAAHLNPEFEGASRKLATIEKTVNHLIKGVTQLYNIPDEYVMAYELVPNALLGINGIIHW
jgi:hypothetical protein